jgi:putative transposase
MPHRLARIATMPRRHRLGPGIARHVIQRGNARRPRFFAEIDHIRYLQDLREITRRENHFVRGSS